MLPELKVWFLILQFQSGHGMAATTIPEKMTYEVCEKLATYHTAIDFGYERAECLNPDTGEMAVWRYGAIRVFPKVKK